MGYNLTLSLWKLLISLLLRSSNTYKHNLSVVTMNNVTSVHYENKIIQFAKPIYQHKLEKKQVVLLTYVYIRVHEVKI